MPEISHRLPLDLDGIWQAQRRSGWRQRGQRRRWRRGATRCGRPEVVIRFALHIAVAIIIVDVVMLLLESESKSSNVFHIHIVMSACIELSRGGGCNCCCRKEMHLGGCSRVVVLTQQLVMQMVAMVVMVVVVTTAAGAGGRTHVAQCNGTGRRWTHVQQIAHINGRDGGIDNAQHGAGQHVRPVVPVVRDAAQRDIPGRHEQQELQYVPHDAHTATPLPNVVHIERQQAHRVEAQRAVRAGEAHVQFAYLQRRQIRIAAVEVLHVHIRIVGIRATGAVVQTRLAGIVEMRTQSTHHMLAQLCGQVGRDEAETEGGLGAPQIAQILPHAKVTANAHDLHHADEQHRQQQHHHQQHGHSDRALLVGVPQRQVRAEEATLEGAHGEGAVGFGRSSFSWFELEVALATFGVQLKVLIWLVGLYY